METLRRYHEIVRAQLDAAFESQAAALEAAADAMASALVARRWVFLAGTGHSHLLALELFYRAGGLVRAVPILDEDLMLHRSASASSGYERESGRADNLLEKYGVASGDVLVVISNSGRNAVPVELALGGRRLGVKVIALTSRVHSLAHPSRHASGRRLLDVADIVLDNLGVEGDASVELMPGLRMGATSTAIGAALLQAVASEAANLAVGRGWNPEVYRSSNGAGERDNARYLEVYRGRIPHL